MNLGYHLFSQSYKLLPFGKGEVGWDSDNSPYPLFREEGELNDLFANSTSPSPLVKGGWVGFGICLLP